MTGFLIRTLISAFGLWVASKLVPSLRFDDDLSLFLAAALLGLANAFVRPLLVVLTFPITLVTLGAFLLVVNAAMLGLVAAVLDGFALGGFWSALFGSLIVSLTGWVASGFIGPQGRFEVMVARRRSASR